MESLIELLSLISLYCALRLTFTPHLDEKKPRIPRRTPGISLSLIAGFASGLALGAHPEALTSILPPVLIILFSKEISRAMKWAFVTIVLATPAAIWAGTYGHLSMAALRQIAYIAKRKAPDPSMPQFGLDLLKRATSSQHDLMVFFFFSLTVVVLITAFIQMVHVGRRSKVGSTGLDSHLSAVNRALLLSIPFTLAILLFLLPASITRYEVFYPIYLLMIAVVIPIGTAAAYGLTSQSRWPS